VVLESALGIVGQVADAPSVSWTRLCIVAYML
jgi:hypothetical protein